MRRLVALALMAGLVASGPRARAQSTVPDAPPPKRLGDGIRPFVGVTAAGGNAFALNVSGERFGGAAFLALRGGVWWGSEEIALEVSPLTDFYFVPNPSVPYGSPPIAFQISASYGHMTRLYHSENALADSFAFFWPLRVRVGLAADTLANVFFNGQLDASGVAFGYGHVVVDLLLPSIRFAEIAGSYLGSPTELISLLFGLDVSYVF